MQVDHHGAQLAGLAAADPQRAGAGDADAGFGEPADDGVGGPGDEIWLRRSVATSVFLLYGFESSALYSRMARRVDEMQEHCSRLCQTGPMGKRQDTRDRIEAQIIELGPPSPDRRRARPALSLRAIARDLGMVSSAVYRYVASRDDLLTLLLVDAYSDLADAVDAARAGAGDGWRDRGRGHWRMPPAHWAVAQPASWALLYGSPVPGYHAPAEADGRPGHPGGGRIVRRGGGRIVATDRSAARDLAVPQPLSADFDRLRDEFGFAGDDARGREVFRAVGRPGRRDQPGGVRPVRCRHADRPGAGLRSPGAAAGCTCCAGLSRN